MNLNKELIYIVKTQSLKSDHRVRKELNLLKNNFEKIRVIYSSNDDYDLEFEQKKIRLPGGAAHRNLAIRLMGAIYFSLYSFFLLVFSKNNKSIWVCDPILFPLVYMLAFRGFYVVWDHHELPPGWVLNSKIFRFVFKLSYRSCRVNFHANEARKNYLENILNIESNNSYVLRNYPSYNDFSSEYSDIVIPKTKPIAYLQNSLIKERCGGELCRALIDLGYYIIHAGSSFDQKYMLSYVSEREMQENIQLCGNLPLSTINTILSQSDITLIFYRDNSINQKFCEPNRVYQAMLLNVKIVAGNNPTLVEAMDGYANHVIANTDGHNIIEIKNSITKAKSIKLEIQEYSKYWEDYASLFNDIFCD